MKYLTLFPTAVFNVWFRNLDRAILEKETDLDESHAVRILLTVVTALLKVASKHQPLHKD